MYNIKYGSLTAKRCMVWETQYKQKMKTFTIKIARYVIVLQVWSSRF